MIRVRIDDFDLYRTAYSGQCFRMNADEDGSACLTAFGRHVLIKNTKDDEFEFSCDRDEFDLIWKDYFDLDTDYASFIRSVDPDDSFLNDAVKNGRGIRILRQEPFETLISFIISQRKSIPAIRTSVERLSALCGEKIGDGIYAFPSPKAIASLSESELGSCGLGYRSPYVREAAKRIAWGETDLEEMRSLSDEGLYSALISFTGVGMKVANCVMLFAYHRIGAFPRDVWIKRIEKEHYGGRFPEERYQGFAGILQQFMFYSRG